MAKNKPYVIFAPHIDDEMIGCFQLLEEKQVREVFYFYDLTPERQDEARAVASYYEFIPRFMGIEKNAGNLNSDAVILAPNIRDSHPHHKLVNQVAKSLPNKKQYYSIDMNVRRDRVKNDAKKLDHLIKFYPSQKKLFEQDDKYHLFESLLESDASKMIWVAFQREGIHAYPEAGKNPSLEDVSFLQYPHRHIFHFKVYIEIFHDERDIEFIQFKRWLESLYQGTLDLNHRSCEMIGEELYVKILSRYPGRSVKIEVSEDNENGAVVEYML